MMAVQDRILILPLRLIQKLLIYFLKHRFDIFFIQGIDSLYEENVKPMFEEVYEELLDQAQRQDEDSILYRHHMDYPPGNKRSLEEYRKEDPNQIVVDFISSMTDDYFIALYHEMFPDGKYDVQYKGYFDQE